MSSPSLASVSSTVRLGYACINTVLHARKPKITCNRGMIKRTFGTKGIEYASYLALQNTQDLVEIIKWNHDYNIQVFRITSSLFPWGSEYELEDLPDFDLIKSNLETAGILARQYHQRLSFHPGPFNILASPNPAVVKNACKELEMHGKIFDLMAMPQDHWSKINIHVGAAYGDHKRSLERWCNNFENLSSAVKNRLTVENDDKKNLYSTKMLYDGIYKRIQVPIVFDSHHFECGPQDISYEDSLSLAIETWPANVKPQCHHSNSRKKYEDSTCLASAHSSWYYTPFNSCGHAVDVVLECKMKEQALFAYRRKWASE